MAELLRSVGVRISDGQVSNLLIKIRPSSTPKKTPSTRRGWPVVPGSIWMTRARA